MSPEIVFGEDRIEYLADLFDKEVNDDGHLVDPEDGEVVPDEISGEPITIDELGVVHHNSEHYIKDEVGDLLHYATEMEE